MDIPPTPPADSRLTLPPRQSATIVEPGPSALHNPVTIESLLDRIKSLEAQVKDMEKDSSSPTSSDDQTTETKEDHVDRWIPEVRHCNWESFKNRYCPEESQYAVEVLVSGPSLRDEVVREIVRRRQKNFGSGNRGADNLHQVLNSDFLDEHRDRWIERVRVQSQAILRILGNVSSRKGIAPLDTGLPATFLHPFQHIIHFHEDFRHEFNSLVGSAVQDANTTGPISQHTGADSVAGPALPPADQAVPGENCCSLTEHEIKEVQCYIEFVNKSLMPRFNSLRADDLSDSCNTKVRFNELWYVFKHGELLYLPPARNKNPSQNFRDSPQRIWRAYSIKAPESEWRVEKIEESTAKRMGRLSRANVNTRYHGKFDGELVEEGVNYVQIVAYYLDYTGKTFCPAGEEFRIPQYTGEIEITALPIYPLRFAQNRTRIIAEVHQEREVLKQYLPPPKSKRIAHTGWCSVRDVPGARIEERDYDRPMRPTYVDCEVVIDFEEAFQARSDWRPMFFSRHVWDGSVVATCVTDPEPVQQWEDRRRLKCIRETSEIYDNTEGGSMVTRQEFLAAEHRFLLRPLDHADTPYSGYSAENSQSSQMCDEDDLLLPNRILAYAFEKGDFFPLSISQLRVIEFTSDPFDDLKINDQHKTNIRSVIHSHFERSNSDLPSQDIIEGKGRGTVILLHGAPGVGKTATAEAVAQFYSKPLYSISCGDLGLGDEVEENLGNIFRLAQTWGCILLFDEADVFLTKRTLDDLSRNAMVSVLLRYLEYYSGILFLTTNRDGLLDEAVKSRLHLVLYYPPLSRNQTVEIFQLNIARLDAVERKRSLQTGQKKLVIFKDEIEAFASEHYEKARKERFGGWNGRQIRNAFQVASALALYKRVIQDCEEAQLGAEQFRIVAKTMRRYDLFRLRVHGQTESEQAMEYKHRDDEFDEDSDGDGGIAPAGSVKAGSSPLGPSYITDNNYATRQTYQQNSGPVQTPYMQQTGLHTPQGQAYANPGAQYGMVGLQPQQQQPMQQVNAQYQQIRLGPAQQSQPTTQQQIPLLQQPQTQQVMGGYGQQGTYSAFQAQQQQQQQQQQTGSYYTTSGTQYSGQTSSVLAGGGMPGSLQLMPPAIMMGQAEQARQFQQPTPQTQMGEITTVQE